MKLLMISTDKKMFQRGSGVAMRQMEYARNFEELHIIVFAPKSFEATTLGNNVWVYPTKSRSKFLYPFDAIKLGKFIIKGRGITDITTEDSSLTAMAGVSLKRRFKIPLEINVHTDIGAKHFIWSIENKIRKAMALSYIPKADKIRVVSERIKNYLTETIGISADKITVRPIPVDFEKIKNTSVTANLHLKYTQFNKIILMASRLVKEKNIEMAIRAWSKVIQQYPQAGLVIVGEGPEKENIIRLVDKLGLGYSVKFEEWANIETLISYYKTANVFLNTSWYEGYGLTLAEANAAGCKIVSTDVGIAREVGATIVDWKAEDVARGIIEKLS